MSDQGPPQDAWPHKMEAEAASPWNNLAKLSKTSDLVCLLSSIPLILNPGPKIPETVYIQSFSSFVSLVGLFAIPTSQDFPKAHANSKTH